MNRSEPEQPPPLAGGHPSGAYPNPVYPEHGTVAYQSVADHHQTPSGNSHQIRGGPIIVVTVIAIAVAAVILTRGSKEPAQEAAPTQSAVATTVQASPTATVRTSPTGMTGAEQARLIDQLLAESELGRDYLGAAITDINACRITSTMYSNLNAAIDNRANLITRTDALVVTSIPEGVSLKTKLRALFSASHDADVAYLAWVRAAGSSCPRTSDFSYQAIVAANNNAQAAKISFLAEWNAVAARYGLPQRSNTEI